MLFDQSMDGSWWRLLVSGLGGFGIAFGHAGLQRRHYSSVDFTKRIGLGLHFSSHLEAFLITRYGRPMTSSIGERIQQVQDSDIVDRHKVTRKAFQVLLPSPG